MINPKPRFGRSADACAEPEPFRFDRSAEPETEPEIFRYERSDQEVRQKIIKKLTMLECGSKW